MFLEPWDGGGVGGRLLPFLYPTPPLGAAPPGWPVEQDSRAEPGSRTQEKQIQNTNQTSSTKRADCQGVNKNMAAEWQSQTLYCFVKLVRDPGLCRVHKFKLRLVETLTCRNFWGITAPQDCRPQTATVSRGCTKSAGGHWHVRSSSSCS